jgi:mannose-6-phosphate isomerase-like protein (cupin superfamily)
MDKISKRDKSSFNINIEDKTISNNNYREVLYTGSDLQLVVMSLKPKEDIGAEVHSDTDQFIRVEKGNGKAIIDEKEIKLSDGIAIIIPAGKEHNIINTSNKELKLYTIYSKPEHKDGLVEKNKK